MFAEKLISPHRKGATWAKLPKDRSAKLGDHEKRNENREEDEVKTRELDPDEEDQNAKTLLIKNLPDKVTQHELKEVFEDAFQISLVSKDGMSKRIAYVDFKSQANAERAREEKQGTEVGGLAIVLDSVAEKSQGQEDRDGQSRTQRAGPNLLDVEEKADDVSGRGAAAGDSGTVII
ncbi:Nucleolin [Pteropus alecto]|uniref:Nucleolin n=1 Tax=Pteropus alecto TaxID=9402 RepID=L5L045_PTEAL|nr:Nucleolin [Pteropus alecto]